MEFFYFPMYSAIARDWRQHFPACRSPKYGFPRPGIGAVECLRYPRVRITAKYTENPDLEGGLPDFKPVVVRILVWDQPEDIPRGWHPAAVDYRMVRTAADLKTYGSDPGEGWFFGRFKNRPDRDGFRRSWKSHRVTPVVVGLLDPDVLALMEAGKAAGFTDPLPYRVLLDHLVESASVPAELNQAVAALLAWHAAHPEPPVRETPPTTTKEATRAS